MTMSDKDLSNLPILDDIIEPGDVEKAKHNSSSKVQGSLPQANRGATSAPTASKSDTVTEHDQIEQDLTRTTKVVSARPSDPVAANPPEQTPSARSDSPLDPPPSQSNPDTEQTIEELTETILSSLLPDLEQLLRIKIRQSLQDDLDPHFSPGPREQAQD